MPDKTTTIRIHVAGDEKGEAVPVKDAKVEVETNAGFSARKFTNYTNEKGDVVVVTQLFNAFTVVVSKPLLGEYKSTINAGNRLEEYIYREVNLSKPEGAIVVIHTQDSITKRQFVDAVVTLEAKDSLGLYSEFINSDVQPEAADD